MLAEYMNHPLDWVGKYRNVNTDVAPVSLSTFLTDDGDLELGDTIVDTRAQEEYDEMIIEEEREIIDAALAQLHEEDRRILILRCGLKGEDSRTLEDTALKMGSTREHVRLREEKAMKQLHEILSVSLEAYRD
jgi:RNA polymerase primary sigma factor